MAALPASGAEAASLRSCGKYDGERYQAKNLSCKAAKKVLAGAGLTLCFDNEIPGWRKVWKPLPSGGRALSLEKGAKVIKTSACSPD